MKKIAIRIASTAALLALLPAAVAFAAQPANHACLGEDFSGYAKDFQPLGQTLLSLGVVDGGLGTEVQLHQAGLVPDGFLPNTCND